jgi:hypothetical protein
MDRYLIPADLPTTSRHLANWYFTQVSLQKKAAKYVPLLIHLTQDSRAHG